MEKPSLSKSKLAEEKSSQKPEQSEKNDVSTKHQAFADYKYEEPSSYAKMFYDFTLWLLWNIFQCFFREIRSRGGFKVPKDGPVIFVAAPHANQFVDPVILMERVKMAINKRVSFLIAESSLHVRFIGFLARSVMAIGVVRPQDNLAPVTGKIKVDPNDFKKIIGTRTKFLTECKPKGLIGLPKSMGNVEIQSIESDTVLYLRKEFKMNKPEVRKLLLNKGTSFKFAQKVDQSYVYHKVFEHLANNECIGIFPEGGSHDRTDLLPIKAGVAIMALGCMAKHPDTNVQIVPCGMNYFHAHKFRSRAVVEFGDPIEIPKELVEMYQNPETNREAVKLLLDTITEGLKTVTVTCEDYETLMVVQAMRRLYSSQFQVQLPLPLVIEMNRRLVKGYEIYKNEPSVKKLAKDILKYNDDLKYNNIPDHLVETARNNFTKNLGLLVYRSVFITIAFLLSLPGIIMFSPIFILANRISKEKARKALAKSSVKIKANDVIATWKILMGMVFTPLLYIVWSSLITIVVSKKGYNNNKILTFVISYILCATVTYSALIVGDRGMDTLKSLRPLYLSLTSPQGLKQLKKTRESLKERIIEIVTKFGSELFPDFDSSSFIREYQEDEVGDRKTRELRRRRILRKQKEKRAQQEKAHEEEGPETAPDSDAISLVNSDNSLSNIPLFSSIGISNKSQSSLTSYSNLTSGSEIEVEDRMIDEEIESDSDAEIIKSKSVLSSKIAQAVLNKRGQKED